MDKLKKTISWVFLVYTICVQILFKDDLQFYLLIAGLVVYIPFALYFIFDSLKNKEEKNNSFLYMILILSLLLLFYFIVSNKFKVV